MSLDAKTLRQTIAAWGHAESETPPRYGDDLRADGINPERRASAVMLILLDTGTDISLVLTQRAAHLPKHPGQISFPGGRAELEDADLLDTARRETREEVGFGIERADVLAALPRYATRTAYDVAPFVALVKPPTQWTPQESEVAEIFEVPLEVILTSDNWRRDGARFAGSPLRHWWAMDIEGRYLWGATAAMLHGFAERLCADLNRPF